MPERGEGYILLLSSNEGWILLLKIDFRVLAVDERLLLSAHLRSLFIHCFLVVYCGHMGGGVSIMFRVIVQLMD